MYILSLIVVFLNYLIANENSLQNLAWLDAVVAVVDCKSGLRVVHLK